MRIDRSRARITPEGFEFPPYRPGDQRPIPLRDAGLSAQEELLCVDRGASSVCFDVRQMAYHHIAQGDLNGLPYLVSF